MKAAQDASDATKAAELKKNIEVQKHYQDATAAIEVDPPTTTLSERMTLFRGGREIQLLYLGRGHTAATWSSTFRRRKSSRRETC